MGTAIVLLILVCVVSAILHHLIKRKKSGQGICSCGTGSCGGCSACKPSQQNEK